jgi:putative oxidoreductase
MLKKITRVNNDSNTTSAALLIARISMSILMLTHGIPKLIMLFTGDVQFLPLFGLSAETSLTLAVFAEVICSFLILVGLGTRLATIPLIITMLIAAVFVHSADPFVRQEPALHYLAGYIFLLIAGAGRYSVDYLIQENRLRSRRGIKIA